MSVFNGRVFTMATPNGNSELKKHYFYFLFICLNNLQFVECRKSNKFDKIFTLTSIFPFPAFRSPRRPHHLPPTSYAAGSTIICVQLTWLHLCLHHAI